MDKLKSNTRDENSAQRFTLCHEESKRIQDTEADSCVLTSVCELTLLQLKTLEFMNR